MKILTILSVLLLCSFQVSGQWTQLPDFQNAGVISLASKGSKLFALVQSQGVYESNNNGVNWVARNDSLNIYGPTKIIIFGNTLFAFGYSGVLYKMNVNDTSWTQILVPSGSFAFTAEGSTYLVSANAPNPNIYRSTDSGVNWNQVNLPGDPVVVGLGKNGTTFFAGTTYGGIHRSTDDGVTWEQVSSANVVNTFYSHSSGFYANAQVQQVMRTTDNGNSWETVNNGISFTNIIASFSSSGSTMFAGSLYNGVYSTNDAANGWVEINTGLTSTSVNALEAAGGYLFAGTSWAGIWRRPLSQIVSVEQNNISSLPGSFELFQNYPNPFNPSTKISWHSPIGSWQTLKVYDILGNEVATLVDEYKPAGKHEVNFRTKGLTSGIYFYKLKTNTFVETKKMILLN
jgi:photosystem II stability/assembly factor-like uncharacterized protein